MVRWFEGVLGREKVGMEVTTANDRGEVRDAG